MIWRERIAVRLLGRDRVVPHLDEVRRTQWHLNQAASFFVAGPERGNHKDFSRWCREHTTLLDRWLKAVER